MQRKEAGNGLVLVHGNPDSLSHYILQNIGRRYLDKHPSNPRSCRISFMDAYRHQNQAPAYKLKNYVSASDPYEKWTYLAETYALLTQSKGELSDAILRAFQTAFNKSVYTHENLYKPGIFADVCTISYFSPQLISTGLKGIVNEYYACKYQSEIVQADDKKPSVRLR